MRIQKCVQPASSLPVPCVMRRSLLYLCPSKSLFLSFFPLPAHLSHIYQGDTEQAISGVVVNPQNTHLHTPTHQHPVHKACSHWIPHVKIAKKVVISSYVHSQRLAIFGILEHVQTQTHTAFNFQSSLHDLKSLVNKIAC